MEKWNALMTRVWLMVTVPREDERGDVPGWVLVTIMTAGLVTGLWKFAGPQLQLMLSNALNQVK